MGILKKSILFRMWNRLSGCRSLIARSTRRFTAAPEAAERSYIKAYWETGAHGPELYVLTAYCTLCTGFMLYNLLISHGSRNEFSHFPFMNKDYHSMINNKTEWLDPRSQRNFTTTDNSPNFFIESAWKNELQELLNEIHE